MKKIYLLLFTLMFSFAFLLTAGPVVANEAKENISPAKVKLTEEQIRELSNLHDQILEKRKEVISKYVEYGVITEEKAKIIITNMENHHKKLEENSYLPMWDHKKHKGHKRSEE